jgi:TP901 family phage tail tape measure protein
MAVARMRVPTIFTAVDKFSGVVTRMTRSVSAFGETAQASAARTSRQFNRVGTSLLTAGVGIAIGLGYAVNEAVKFEDRIANIGTLLPELNNIQLEGVGKKLLEIAKGTSKPIQEITTSFYDLISAGIKLNDAYPLLKSIDNLSISGLGSLTEATDIQLAAMRNFKSSFKDSDDAANALFKTVKYGVTTVSKLSESFSQNAGFAGDLGLSGQEFMASIVGLTATKMPTSQAEVGIGSITNQIGKTTAKRNKILFGIFRKLGVNNGNDLLKKSGGFLPAITAISREAKKAGINIQSIFPEKRASNTFLKLTGNIDAIEAYNKSLAHLNDKTENAIAVARKLKEETAAFKIGQLKNQMLSLAITIGEALLPRIKGFIDGITPTIEGITEWADNNKWLANTLMTTAKWLLILGITAKVGAFLFYGLSKAIGIVTAITEAYRFISTLAALANVGFGTALWGVVTALWAGAIAEAAFLAPILLIIAALGLLTYALWDIGTATDSTITKQVTALDKGNQAWRNATKVQAEELAKQRALMKTPKAPVSKERTKMHDILVGEQKRQSITNALKPNNLPPINESIAKKLYETRQMETVIGEEKANTLRNQGFTFEEFQKVYPNVAGYKDRAATDNKIGGTLKIIVDKKGDLQIDDSQVNGIKVETTSTKKTSDSHIWDKFSIF